MEPDRFKQSHTLYIIGMVSLVISVGLFAFCFYLIPFLAFSWYHGVPDFIISMSSELQETYKLSRSASSWFIFISVFFPAAVCAVVADVLSNRIDSEIHAGAFKVKEVEHKTEKMHEDSTESRWLVFKIISIIIIVFIAAKFFQWMIST